MTSKTPLNLAELHAALGNSARQYEDLQRLRVASGNRVDAMRRDGVPEVFILPVIEAMARIEEGEKALDTQMSRLMRQHPMGQWITQTKGLSHRHFAALFGATGPLDAFSTVSKLWKYVGMSVDQGSAPRRRKGERAMWSPRGRVICHLIGEAIVKTGEVIARCGEYTTHSWSEEVCQRCGVVRGSAEAKQGEVLDVSKYRAAYNRKREEYFTRSRLGPSNCPMGQEHRTSEKEGKGVLQCVKLDEETGRETSAHLHAAAMRYAVKELLKDAWCEWRRVIPADSLTAET